MIPPFEIDNLLYRMNYNPETFCPNLTIQEREQQIRRGIYRDHYAIQHLYLQRFYVMFVDENYIPDDSLGEREFLKTKISDFITQYQLSLGEE